MTSLREAIRRMLTPVRLLPSGIYHYQAPPDSPQPYRLHLRLEPDGSGILVVNATTVLHLNQTAAEYAYHLVTNSPKDQMARQVSNRYRVDRQQALQDYQNLVERIETLITTPDLDPETFLDFERAAPHVKELSAPLRLDCALTYRLPADSDPSAAPTKRVERELTTTEWIKILDKAWAVGIPHIIFTGGEPTLRDDLSDLIAQAEANGQVTGLLTDGLRLSDSAYLDTLLQTGLDHLMLSLQPENELAWKALENALAADLFVAVHLTITLSNVMEAPDLLTRLAASHIKALSLSAADPSLHNTLTELRNKAAALGLPLVWDLPVPYSAFNPIALEIQEDAPAQGAGRAWLYIEPDGDVLPAQGINHVLGNFLADPWEKIWQ
jgi:hypothetical protein